ncbi:hypothetical protein QZM35_08615 [Burkholderia sp. AU45274]|uniref:hypothetical protein n=1 Tax=Burkholderia sp. AU45274 TaxID=3059205 RepID=UPI002653494E|nr:hypothetical protein [Burkholderia sp. AU45274]MDN7487764.1 hypothetical protein [Burkholderia sp. AU45274]
MRESRRQKGVEFECFINEKCVDNGLKTFPECAANRVIRCVKGRANESEKMMCGVTGARFFICFNYYAAAKVLFFTVDFGPRAACDPVGIFTDESNPSRSSGETPVEDVPEAALSGFRCAVSGESILVSDGTGRGRTCRAPRFAGRNARAAGLARQPGSQV